MFSSHSIATVWIGRHTNFEDKIRFIKSANLVGLLSYLLFTNLSLNYMITGQMPGSCNRILSCHDVVMEDLNGNQSKSGVLVQEQLTSQTKMAFERNDFSLTQLYITITLT